MLKAMLLDSLELKVLPAPMAGGPTTPELVRAAHTAGSFGTLAWGTSPVSDALLDDVPDVPFGVNLFYPQSAEHTFGWHEKLDLALSAGASVVWSMFGGFTDKEIDRIHAAGAEAWTTVTTPAEAQAASGADVLCVQGPKAGGHRGTWDPYAEPDQRSLEELLELIDGPVIAAGGLRTAADVAAVLARPNVVAVSCGSAFLLSDEAGTSEWNRELLRAGGKTVCSRAFSGRYARGLETDYTRSHPNHPMKYPELNAELAERRAQRDPAVAYCLVGTEVEKISGGSTARILQQLSII